MDSNYDAQLSIREQLLTAQIAVIDFLLFETLRNIGMIPGRVFKSRCGVREIEFVKMNAARVPKIVQLSFKPCERKNSTDPIIATIRALFSRDPTDLCAVVDTIVGE